MTRVYHTTGKVRGLLCRPCNAAIGAFKESPEIINKAIVYLEKYSVKSH